MYRPPPSIANGLSVSTFLNEWDAYLGDVLEKQQRLLIVGDLNFHLDKLSDPDTRQFLGVVESHGLVQSICDPTHSKGHILDVTLTQSSNSLLMKPPLITDPGLSDHMAIHLTIRMAKQPGLYRHATFRRCRDIPLQSLCDDLTSIVSKNIDSSLEDLVDMYNTSLTSLMDKYAPVQTKYTRVRPNTQWYTQELREVKQKKRRSERQWLNTKLTVHKEMYRHQCIIVNNMLLQGKQVYYRDRLDECGRDQAKIYRLTKHLLGQGGPAPLPTSDSPQALAQTFCDFFSMKITKIHETIGRDGSEDPLALDTPFVGSPLSDFLPATEEEIRKLILKAPNKCCELDPAPTWLIKECSSQLTPLITDIVNESLRSGTVPIALKKAIIRARLKKPGLDKEALKNYRPVSNLPFISKLLEKVVDLRFKEHLHVNQLRDTFQSAYEQNHSTETALLKVQSDICEALDTGSMVALLMLDLSAAFDTLDHSILVKRFEYSYGITGKALQWVSSYLADRTQSVAVDSATSKDCILRYGVPQGSVLGPKKYCMYTRPVGTIVKNHGLSYHGYADDTQGYVVIRSTTHWIYRFYPFYPT